MANRAWAVRFFVLVLHRKNRKEERKCRARLTREYTDGGSAFAVKLSYLYRSFTPRNIRLCLANNDGGEAEQGDEVRNCH